MTEKAVLYHAGCSVCVDVEQRFARALDQSLYDVEIVHPGEQKARLADATVAGHQSVPAFVIGDAIHHIDCGAGVSALG